jgi:hypothetical protein
MRPAAAPPAGRPGPPPAVLRSRLPAEGLPATRRTCLRNHRHPAPPATAARRSLTNPEPKPAARHRRLNHVTTRNPRGNSAKPLTALSKRSRSGADWRLELALLRRRRAGISAPGHLMVRSCKPRADSRKLWRMGTWWQSTCGPVAILRWPPSWPRCDSRCGRWPRGSTSWLRRCSKRRSGSSSSGSAVGRQRQSRRPASGHSMSASSWTRRRAQLHTPVGPGTERGRWVTDVPLPSDNSAGSPIGSVSRGRGSDGFLARRPLTTNVLRAVQRVALALFTGLARTRALSRWPKLPGRSSAWLTKRVERVLFTGGQVLVEPGQGTRAVHRRTSTG